MIFTETHLPGAFVLDPERLEDERGFFARTFSSEEFAARGLNPRLVQCNMSFNTRRGTLRGFHWQIAPKAEVKLVRATQGAIYDVIVDLRAGSATRFRHFGVELTADNRRLLYIPEGFAHAFQTLTDRTEIFYQMSEFYAPDHARGARWNDPLFAVSWPVSEPIINARDRNWPDYQPLGQ